MRDADDPGPALEEIAVAAYTDSSARLLGDYHGLMHTCVHGAGEMDEPLVTFS